MSILGDDALPYVGYGVFPSLDEVPRSVRVNFPAEKLYVEL